ncbi:MAG: GIY-YIG nuclease family protein [bacterium]|nr:GIY-YIG nuclease family protein [bacterium]
MAKPWHWYVYVIECMDGTYYTGCTWDISIRYNQHLSGKGSKYTRKHGVRRLAYVEYHENLEGALLREKQIKDWSQQKKRKLISGVWQAQW